MTQHRDPIEMRPDQDFRGDPPDSIDELNPQEGGGSPRKEGGVGAVVVHHTVTTLLVVMVASLATWGYLSFKDAGGVSSDTLSMQGPLFERTAGDAQLQRFHFALDVFYTLYGKYPPDLEALADEGLLAGSDLEHPKGTSTYIYRRIGDTYELGIERTFTTLEVVEPKPAQGEAAAVLGEADAGTETEEAP